MQFNEKLKKLRHQRGISQAELAAKIFVSRSAIAKWENGLGLPSEESLALLASYFSVDESMLVSDPIIEDTIVKKNTILTRQKAWIMILSFLLVMLTGILLIWAMAYQNHQSLIPMPDSSHPIRVTTRELIFDTEKGLDTFSIPRYLDEELSVNQYFADSRIIVIGEFETTILPKLLVKTTRKGKVTYTPIDIDKITFYCSLGLKTLKSYSESPYGCIHVYLQDSSVQVYEGYLNIKYEDLVLSVKVLRKSMPINQMHIELSDHSMELGLIESKMILLNSRPFDATYISDSFINIIKIEKEDGTYYEGNLSKYIKIEKKSDLQWLITPTYQIEIGSKVYIQAENMVEEMQSNILTIEIKRIPIERIVYTPYQSYIDSGTTHTFQLSIYPSNATANMKNESLEVTLLTPDIACLDQKENEWQLTASQKFEAIHQVIQLQVKTIEGYTQIIEWKISPIPIEQIHILNAETDKELEANFHLTRGSRLTLEAIVEPENASYENIHYQIYANINNFGRYVSISEEGILTIAEDAPFDLEIWLSATCGMYSSPGYHIQIQKRHLDTVILQCESMYLEKKKIYKLSIQCNPLDADVDSIVQFVMLDQIEGIYLSGDLIYVNEGVEIGTMIRIMAVVEGIQSNVIELCVV